MGKHKGREEVELSHAFVAMLRANIMAYAVTAIFIIFISLILTYTQASPKLESWLMTMGIILSSFLAGFDTAKVEHKNGYKWGAVGGALYFFIFLILGLCFNQFKNIAPGMICLVAILVIFSSMIAGMISVNCQK